MFFRRLPLPVKLMLIGLIPLTLMIYLFMQLISEQEKKLDLLNGYITRIHQASDLSKLINSLQVERRYSFENALKGGSKTEMIQQRYTTDSLLEKIKANYEPTLGDFKGYTFLSDLDSNRMVIDSGKMNANSVMHFYTTSVFRLNTMTGVAAGNNLYLDPIYKELVSQKILSEIITYLSIIRINVYNALYTRGYMTETLVGTLGTYDIYKSYVNEFYQKASPAAIKDYEEILNNSSLKPTMTYVDRLFKTFQFDSTYTHQQWWTMSLEGNTKLRGLQEKILANVEEKINIIYANEKNAELRTIILLIVMILLGIFVIVYTIRSITVMLLELKMAAQQIASGETGLKLQKLSNDVIGNLSDSIMRIDKSNKVLAEAAEAIGKGKFDVLVESRSKDDLLGNAIMQMKNDLQRLTNERNEIEERKDMFITMASHELKTPVTSIQGYVQVLLKMINDQNKKAEELPKPIFLSSLQTIDKQVSKLNRLITELLDLSKIETGQLHLNKQQFNLNQLVSETIKDLQQTTANHFITFQNGMEVDIVGDRDRIGQVLTNLLANAIKYSPKSDKIEVSLYKATDKDISVSIKDYGIGINHDEQSMIFERFYRAMGKEEQSFPGFGIGLFIANDIIQKHNGTMTVNSEKDKGSTFTFTIPFSRETANS